MAIVGAGVARHHGGYGMHKVAMQRGPLVVTAKLKGGGKAGKLWYAHKQGAG